MAPISSPNCTRLNNDADWWHRAVIYQIYPRSFQDSNGDGIGDLLGIEQRLSYLAELGVDAVWISPFFRSPMADFGYDVSDHRDVDPLFGTLEDFDRLLAAAHALGIRIIIDLVLSHTASVHPWFVSSRESRDGPDADLFVWADPGADGGPPNNWLSVFGGPAWTWEPKREQYYLHNFLDSQPDLNFHNPRVRQEALSLARWWLERGVDGFRLDTVNFYFHDTELRDNPLATVQDDQIVAGGNPYGSQDHLYDKNRPEMLPFLDSFGAVLAEYSGSMALGEVGAADGRAIPLMQEYQAAGRLSLCYTFDLLSDRFSAAHFRHLIVRDQEQGPDVWRCLAFSNHDIRRSASRFGGERATPEQIAPLTMALLLSLKGTPCIYQGEELGLPEADIPFEQIVDPYGKTFWPSYKGRDGCRTPMPWASNEPHGGFTVAGAEPWLPVVQPHLHRAMDGQQANAESVLAWTQKLLTARQGQPGLVSSSLTLCDAPEEALVFRRGQGESSVLGMFNLGTTVTVVTLPEDKQESTVLVSGGEVTSEGDMGCQVRLGPWSWAWLR